jgi:hypothetical protein
MVQEPEEPNAPPVPPGADEHGARGATQAADTGQVTAVDETTMKEEDLEEAVGLLTQLEVGTPPN